MRLTGDLTASQRAQAQGLYEGAFPPALSAPFDSLFEDEVLAYVDGPLVAGLVVVRRLTGTGTGTDTQTGMAFVRYFAAARRGAGVGSAMWTELRAHLADCHRVVLDVEHPDEPGLSPDEADIRRRRVVFYERLGLQVLPVRGYAPPHDPDDPDDTHPMLLLATDADDLAATVLAVHQHRYGLAPDHPVVRRVLEASGLG